MPRPRWLYVASMLVSSCAVITGCTSATHSGAGGHATSLATAPLTATRWWSDGAGPAGSTINTTDPTMAAGKLTPNTPTYCAALKSTLGSGKSVFAGANPTDPAIVNSTKAWIAELSALAPSSLHPAWQTFGSAVLNLLASAAKSSGAAVPSMTAAQTSAFTAAQNAIESEAKTDCGVNLFPAASSSSTPSK